MIAIIAALQDEIKLIKSELEVDKAIHLRPFSIYTGKYYSEKIALLRSGVGKEASRKALLYCLENLPIQSIVNIGYAGGLDPHLQTGDLVFATSIIEESTEKESKLDEMMIINAKTVAESEGQRYHTGKVVTVDKPLTDPHEKAFVGTKFEALACEMESAAIADIASEKKIPLLIARSVIDPMDVELPGIPEKAIADGDLRIGPLLRHLKSSPKDIFKLPKFSYLANQARISITNFVKAWAKNVQNL